MLDRKLLRTNLDEVKAKLSRRGFDVSILDDFVEIDKKRRETTLKVDELNQSRNEISKKIGALKRNGEDATEFLNQMEVINEQRKTFDEILTCYDSREREILISLPNIQHESVPFGKGEEDNVEIKRVGEIREFSFNPKPHEEIGENLDILDFKRGAKVTGSRFVFYKGLGAKLERALINFMLDIQTEENGYTEFIPPQIVNGDSLFGTGQLPKFEEDLFKLRDSNYYLIPTAEVPVTNYHRDEILHSDELPRNYTAYSACFRSEAGSAGRDTKGIIRQHQFNKVELVKLVKPSDSYAALEDITRDAESILERLELPYRRVLLCSGDAGFGSAKTFDLEVWFPSQGKYREISSATNFEDFQARRANIRFKETIDSKTEFVHTLNASGLAVGRTLAAILENYQREDGSVVIPEALIPYMRGLKEIKG